MSKKIRVLNLPLANSKGGMARYELNNWKWINKSVFHFDFVSFSDHLDYEDEIIRTGARVFYMKNYAELNPEGFSEEFRDILKNGYDIVHLHTNMWGSLLAEKIAKEEGVKKVIIHSHSTSCFSKDDNFDVKKRHEENKKTISEDIATDFWACSKEAAEWLYGDYIPKEKIKIMPNAIETEKYSFNKDIRKKYREELDLENKFVLGCIANFIYQKNHEFLINLMKKMGDDTVLLLVGSGPLQEKVKLYAQSLGVQDRVVFLGYRNDADMLYQCIDVYLLPSIAEAFPFSTVEAQVSGVKCIVSDNVTPDVDFTSNIWHEDLDIDKWVNRIELIRNALPFEERRTWSNECKEKGLCIDTAIENLEKAYLS